MKRFPYQLSPDSGGGGGADAPASPPQGDNSPASPPAAAVVMESGANEADAGELVKTKRQLEDERKARKLEQTRLSELEDENRRLKSAGLAPGPHPAPPAPAVKKSWLAGWSPVIGSDDED